MDARPLIAIFCNSFPPEGGAAAQRMHHIAVLLRDAGYRLEVISNLPNYPQGRIFPGYRGQLQSFETVDGIPVQRCWLYPSNSAAAFPRALNLLSQMSSFRLLAFRRILKLKPALVIVSSPPLLMAAAAVQYFRKAGVPVLLNISDLWPLSARALGAASERGVYRFLQGREHRMYRQASAISGQSKAILDHVQQYPEAAIPAFLLRNLPEPAPILHTEPPIDNPHRLRIIYPGLLGHAQGLRALIAAIDWKALNAQLDIYGEGAELTAIRAWIRANPEQPVHCFATVPAAELQKRFADYGSMLIPLVSDIPGAVPSKLFTAIQAGLPVLYSAGGEGAEIVRERGLGFVSAPGNYTELADSIRAMQQLPADSRKTLRTALQEAAAYFNRDIQDQQFLAFLAGLIGPR